MKIKNINARQKNVEPVRLKSWILLWRIAAKNNMEDDNLEKNEENGDADDEDQDTWWNHKKRIWDR